MKALATTTIAAFAITVISLSSTAEAGCRMHDDDDDYDTTYHSYAPRVVHHEPVYVPQPIIQEVIVEKPVYVPTPVAVQPAPCLRPTCARCVVLPGDTYCTIAQRVYGTPAVWSLLAKYNRLAPLSPLTIGQPLQMPVINQDGTFRQPIAPAAPPAQGPQLPQLPAAQPAPQAVLPPAAGFGGFGGFGGFNIGGLDLANDDQ